MNLKALRFHVKNNQLVFTVYFNYLGQLVYNDGAYTHNFKFEFNEIDTDELLNFKRSKHYTKLIQQVRAKSKAIKSRYYYCRRFNQQKIDQMLNYYYSLDLEKDQFYKFVKKLAQSPYLKAGRIDNYTRADFDAILTYEMDLLLNEIYPKVSI